MGRTFLVSFIPTLKSEYHITYPSNVEVNFKLLNVENIDVKQISPRYILAIIDRWKIKDNILIKF